MSLVENIINQISSNKLNGSGPLSLDLNDDTFSKILDKQFANNAEQKNITNMLGEIGIPAGLNMEFPDGQMNFSTFDINNMNANYENIDLVDLDIGSGFASLLNEKSDYYKLAQKHATNVYNAFSKSFVDDLSEFVTSTSSM